MPNWVTNKISIKGNRENLLSFFNAVLPEKKTEVAEAYDALMELINGESQITMGSWRPMPETFNKIDTTNSPRDGEYVDGEYIPYSEEKCAEVKALWEKEKAYQLETYGVAGWYDYNCFIRFGCKWDADIEDIEYDELDDEICQIILHLDTPWSMPIRWAMFIKETYNFDDVVIRAIEEGGFFNGVYAITESGAEDLYEVETITDEKVDEHIKVNGIECEPQDDTWWDIYYTLNEKENERADEFFENC